VTIENPAEFPVEHSVSKGIQFMEPMIDGTLVFPERYMGALIKLCQERRGIQKSLTYFNSDRIIMVYRLPLNEVVEDFYDVIKSLSSGYASFDYEDAGYEYADVAKLSILLNGDVVDALSTITHSTKAWDKGKDVCARLKKVISRQQFDIAIQAMAKGKVIARESVKALRKDVTAKCYGGDITRKKKLLNKQKEGKKKMRMLGNVEVPKEAFQSIMSRS